MPKRLTPGRWQPQSDRQAQGRRCAHQGGYSRHRDPDTGQMIQVCSDCEAVLALD